MSRIAVIGWGSLIWDLDDLAPRVTGEWQMRAGPHLHMEFSRISPKRKLGLVVCLDEEHGQDCPTHAIASRRDDIREVVTDLAARERAPTERIGYVHGSGEGHSRMPGVVKAVAAWCEAAGWDGAVWTDLEPNFEGYTGEVFSITGGIEYLRGLNDENLEEAHRYIRSAPQETSTPLRRALENDVWWQGLEKDQQS